MRTHYRNGDPVGLPHTGCDTCSPSTINNVFCHETGCASSWKDYSKKCDECGGPFYARPDNAKTCDDCIDNMVVYEEQRRQRITGQRYSSGGTMAHHPCPRCHSRVLASYFCQCDCHAFISQKICYSCGVRFWDTKPVKNWQDCPPCEAAHGAARQKYLASLPSSEGDRAAFGDPAPPPPTTKEP